MGNNNTIGSKISSDSEYIHTSIQFLLGFAADIASTIIKENYKVNAGAKILIRQKIFAKNYMH